MPGGPPLVTLAAARRVAVPVLVAAVAAVGLLGADPRRPGAAVAVTGEPDVRITGAPPGSWDPVRAGDVATAATLAQVHEGLTAFDELARVQPALAERWRIEDAGRRIVFELRPGIRFSDGSPIRAQDVVASWLHVLEPGQSPLWSLLSDVRGAAAYRDGSGRREEVGIRADGDTVVIEARRPAAYLVAAAASPTLAVLQEGAAARIDRPAVPEGFVGSGAYVPVSATATAIRLEANRHYWAGPPPLDVVELVVDLEQRTTVEAFEEGLIDYTDISAFDASWVRYDKTLGPQLRRVDSLSVEYIGFDTSRPPFDDARVRRAVATAVDWDRIAALAGLTGPPVTSLVPPGIAGRGSEDFTPDHDPEAARAELAEAGYPGGRGLAPVRLVFGGPSQGEPLIESVIARQLRDELGIETIIEAYDGDLVGYLEADPPPIFRLSWIADYPAPQDFLGLLLETGSGNNYGRWSNAAYDAALDAAATTDDPAAQARHYAAAQGILRDEVPVVPIAYGESWALGRRGLLGALESGVGFVRFAGLDVEAP
ncbi:MAG TPA: ABC transporter substrate-binding protein [Candidatus Limnocylindrales bacterium]|nr:ABC transporter substrate-binding protein [Candidatus Limnocylindrales bacterium]